MPAELAKLILNREKGAWSKAGRRIEGALLDGYGSRNNTVANANCHLANLGSLLLLANCVLFPPLHYCCSCC